MTGGTAMNKEMKAVIVGGIHHNTLGVIRSLGENGIPENNIKVILVDDHFKKKNIISSSKYVNKQNIVYVRKNEECINALLNSIEEKRQTIICCSDGTAETVIAHCEELEQWYNLPSTKLDIRECMSKEKQSKLAAECGFYLPQSSVFLKHDNIIWNKFPCIIKPIKSVLGGKADIKISNNIVELQSALKNVSSDTIQIQEYINKKMEFQLIGCSLDGGKEVIIPGYTTIIRQPDNTNTGYLKYAPIKELSFDIQRAKKYLNKIGYSGLFSLEFIRDNNNDDYFLEINLRNDGNAYCVKTAGVNLPYIWVYYQTFHKMPNCSKSVGKTVYFMPDWNDFRRGIKTVGVIGWLKESKQAESHAVFNKKDIKPFFIQSLEMAGGCLNYLKRKLLTH